MLFIGDELIGEISLGRFPSEMCVDADRFLFRER